ncbi:MAG: CotH kinase family protein [Planctomycetota bacterium]|nr:CotH kinase family protein [Planctomycetota bacterium]
MILRILFFFIAIGACSAVLADGFSVKVHTPDRLTEKESQILEEIDCPFMNDSSKECFVTLNLREREITEAYVAQEAVLAFVSGMKGIVFVCSKEILFESDFEGRLTASRMAATFVVLKETLKWLKVGSGKKSFIDGVTIYEAKMRDDSVAYLSYSKVERKVKIPVSEGVWRVASLVADGSGKMRRVFRKGNSIEGTLTPSPVLITPVKTSREYNSESADFWEKEEPKVIHLTFSDASWNNLLRTKKEEYVEADFECSGVALKRVGVRFKGNSSLSMSLREEKFPFKIDFDKFEGQSFLGMKKLNLSNNFKDPTMMREYLAYEVFRNSGLWAGRAAFVKLYISVKGKFERKYFGLYTAVEQVDGEFLRRWFGNAEGTLFKPETFGDDALRYRGEEPRLYGNCELKYGELHPDYDSLIQFTRLIDSSSREEFVKRVGEYLDVESFLKFIAINGLLANYDSYIGTGHNFFLYYDAPQGKFIFIPWDMNEAFGRFTPQGYDFDTCAYVPVLKPVVSMDRSRRVLVERIMKEERWARMYREILARLHFSVVAEKPLVERIEQIARFIEPAIKEEGERRLAEFREGVRQLRRFIEQRSAFVFFELFLGSPPVLVPACGMLVSDEHGSVIYKDSRILFYGSDNNLQNALTMVLPPDAQLRLSKKYLIILAIDEVIRVDRKNYKIDKIMLPIPFSPPPSQKEVSPRPQ